MFVEKNNKLAVLLAVVHQLHNLFTSEIDRSTLRSRE